jgi:phosphoribosylformimino-5-aminoimidazole carboxamide ribotide isomerase
MRIIPVIDLKGGVVVHAVAGERQRYKPIRSRLVGSSDPFAVAEAFRVCGFGELYVADLDAIGGGLIDMVSLQRLGDAGLQISLDAGVSCLARARELARLPDQIPTLGSLVLGLESLVDSKLLGQSLGVLGPGRCIFSLDLRNGEPVTTCPTWHRATAWEIADAVIGEGIQRIIVLDLARVGTGQGPTTLELCGELHRTHPNVEIIAGGGVRGSEDLEQMKAAGCSAALVASALHDGRLTLLENATSPEDTDRWQ